MTVHLAQRWLAAKEDEAAANKRRVEIEALILAELGCPEEASKTHQLEGFKITTSGKLNYKADIPQLLTLADQLPADRRPIKTDTRLDETGAKWLRHNEPQLWRLIAPAIEIKPAKPSIKIVKE